MHGWPLVARSGYGLALATEFGLMVQGETRSFVNNWDTCGPQTRSLGMPDPFCFPQNSKLITDGTKGRADLRELQREGAEASSHHA